MRGKLNVNEFEGTQIGVFPKITQLVLLPLQTQILPGIMKCLRRGLEIKHGNVSTILGFRSS